MSRMDKHAPDGPMLWWEPGGAEVSLGLGEWGLRRCSQEAAGPWGLTLSRCRLRRVSRGWTHKPAQMAWGKPGEDLSLQAVRPDGSGRGEGADSGEVWRQNQDWVTG